MYDTDSVLIAVRKVHEPPVRGNRHAPWTFAHLDRANHFIGCRVDDGDIIGFLVGHVRHRAGRGDRHGPSKECKAPGQQRYSESGIAAEYASHNLPPNAPRREGPQAHITTRSQRRARSLAPARSQASSPKTRPARSEEHTSELQSQSNLVCRLLLEKKKLTEVQDSSGQKQRHMSDSCN